MKTRIAQQVLAGLATALLPVGSALAFACVSNATGNWSVAGTWTACNGTTPQAADTAQIRSAHTVTMNTTATVTSLTVGSSVGNNTSTLTFAAGSQLTVNGTVTLSGSNANRGGVTNMTAGGTLIVNSATPFALGSGTVTWTPGAGTVQLSQTNTLVYSAGVFSSFNNLTISGNTTTLGGNTTLTGALVATGTLNTSTFTLGVAGNFTVNGAVSGTGAVSLTGAGATIDGTGSVTNTATLTITTGAKTVLSTANLSFANTIAISGAIIVTNNGTITTTAAGGITGSVAGSTWTNAATSTLNISGPLLATGTLNASANPNTVNYAGAGQTVKLPNGTTPNTYYDLSLGGSGTVTMPGTALSILGNFTTSGTESTTAAAALTVGGNFTVGAGTSLTTGAFDFLVTGTTGITGTLVHSSSTGTKVHTGLVTVNAGGVWNNSGNADVNFRGGIMHNGTTFTAGSGVQTFDTNSQAVGGASSLSIPSATVTGVTLTNNGTLTVATALSGTGGLTNAASAALTVGGTSGITTLTATASPNTVTFNGGSAQTVNATTYHHLTLNNASGGTLGGNATVNGTLTFTSGNLTTGSGNTLTMASTASTSGAGTSKHVVGNLARAFSVATTFTYDIGDGTNYTPMQVTFTASVTGNLTASVTNEDHRNTTAGTSGIDAAKSVNRYWSLKKSTVAGTYAPTWTYVAGDNDAATPANYRIRRGASCSGSLESRTCTPWSSLTVSGTPTNVNAAATGVAITADDPAEADFAIGEPDASTNFLREKQFIYTRELY